MDSELPENTHPHRKDHDQYESGYEGVQMLAKFLESKSGILTVSVNVSQYSQGNMFFPDLVFLNYGIEVKRTNLLHKAVFDRGRQFRTALSATHVNNCGWHYLKEYCRKNGKNLRLITVVAWGKQDPVFVGFEEEQIDAYIADFEKRNPQAVPKETKDGLVWRVYTRKQGPFAGHITTGSFVSINAFEVLREGLILNRPDHFKRFFKDLPPEYLHAGPLDKKVTV